MHSEDTVLVPLTQGKFAIIDAEDAEEILQYKWYAFKSGYAVRNRRPSDGDGPNIIYMHRVIFGAVPGVLVDHANRDKLDNRRVNLRKANHSRNGANSKLSRRNSTGYKGVTRCTRTTKFIAQIRYDGANHILGRFSDPVDAAIAYDKKAIELYGDFAGLNFPDHD